MSNTSQKSLKKTISGKVSMRYAWYALFVLFLINLANYVDRLSIGPAIEHIKRDFLVSDAKIGLIASAFMYTYAILSLPMGWLSDRTRRTRLVSLGAFVWSVSTTVSGFAKHFRGFFIARALVGSGEGIYAPSGTAIVADYFPKRLRTTAIAIFMSAMIVGGALAYIAAGVILKKTDRFNVPLVSQVLLHTGQKNIEGWNALGVEETKDHLVRFRFRNDSGETIYAVFSRSNLKKHADFHSKLFNINYKIDSGNGTGSASADARRFIEKLNARILEREGRVKKEGRNLEVVTAPLMEIPEKLAIPDRYKNIFYYDASGGKLVYRGIMTKADRLALEKLSDNEPYIKALGEIYSTSAFQYMRSDNWRWIFWILGPPGLLFAAMAFFLREPLKGVSEDFLTEEEAQRIDETGKVSYWTLVRTPSIVIMVISNILATYCVGGLNIWLFPFIERYKGIESADAAIQFGPIVVGFAILGVITSGILADKLQKRTAYGNNIVIVLSIVCGVPFMYLFLQAENHFVMIGSIAMCIFFLTWINGPQNSLLMSLVEPRLRAMLNAVHILLIHMLGDAISPTIVGYYSDRYDLRTALATLPIFLIAGGVGFAIAGIFVPKDLKAMEQRMKASAGSG